MLFRSTYELEVGAVTIDACSSSAKSMWFIDMSVNDFCFKAKVDTGAQVNVLSRSVYDKLGCSDDLKPANRTLRAYNGSPIPLLGMIDLSCTYQDRQYPAKFYISKNIRVVIACWSRTGTSNGSGSLCGCG